tara:strand:- start:2 stop:607 length:606 start_codon:yes stop_codon:yes gene_type:complete
MNTNELLDKLEKLGLSDQTRLDLEQRNINKASLNEIANILEFGNPIQIKSDNTVEAWKIRSYHFSGLSHLLLLISSPRLYAYLSADSSYGCLGDQIDDLRLVIDSAINGFESPYSTIKTLEGCLSLNEIKETLEDRFAMDLDHVINNFGHLKIQRSLAYERLNMAIELISENWSDDQTAEELRDRLAEEREQFHFNIAEWI